MSLYIELYYIELNMKTPKIVRFSIIFSHNPTIYETINTDFNFHTKKLFFQHVLIMKLWESIL